MSSTPKDIELYTYVKKLANKKFKSPTGVYKSSWIVKKYKELGGKYKSSSFDPFFVKIPPKISPEEALKNLIFFLLILKYSSI